MSRLTRKNKNEYRCYGSNFTNSIFNDMDSNGDYIEGNCIDKLGQVEDLEEKLGIELVTLFDLVEKKIYVMMHNVDKNKTEIKEAFVDSINYSNHYNHKIVRINYYLIGHVNYSLGKPVCYTMSALEFNKDWFLTEEEAKKALEDRK